MIVKPYTELKPEKVEMKGTANTTIRWLIAEKEGASNFFMRLFEVEPGGHTPFHSHPGEHEIFILDGKGNLNSESGRSPCSQVYLRLFREEKNTSLRTRAMSP